MKHTSKTQSQSHFANVVHADIQRSTFMRNSTKKTTFNCGDIVPIYIDEVLPGDTFDMDMAFISRLTTPIFPTMDIIDLDFYAFFVPNRLVWDGWEELNGENKTGAWVQSPSPALVPQYDQEHNHLGVAISITPGSIGDYYGLPVGMKLNACPVSALPFRGYGLIYNEWFRDQNLQAPILVDKGNTTSIGNAVEQHNYTPFRPLLKANKKHDYFTSCLVEPQKGQSTLIPIEFNQLIPVVTGANLSDDRLNKVGLRLSNLNSSGQWQSDVGSYSYKSFVYGVDGNANKGNLRISSDPNLESSSMYPQDTFVPRNLWANAMGMQMSNSTISELRTAFQIQKLYEKDARGGTRYVEMLKAHFGVDAQDYRLQRPEFLGHYHTYVGIQQVPQTSATGITGSDSPQGNLSAFSYTTGNSRIVKKSFVEHGFIHIFAVARQPKTYQQGVERFWSRRERFDFYLPTLAHISEQPVFKKEICINDQKTVNDWVFGYQEAWADYRYKPNQVTGQFRSKLPNGKSLDNWHYADWYESEFGPFLSSDWIIDNSRENVDRTLAVNSTLTDQILIDIAFKCKASRPMPVHSIPGLIDHF